MSEYIPPRKKMIRLNMNYFYALFRSMVMLGVLGKERFHYWKLFFWTIFKRPRLFPMAITFAIYGFHFRKVFEKYMQIQ
jgi:hypothetical protein